MPGKGEESMYPVIGITMTTREGFTARYVNSVAQNGGVPVIIPILDNTDIIDSALNKLDGIIFSGGADVNPHLYNEEPRYGLGEVTPERDEHEFKLLEKCLNDYQFPILGICRGVQVMNVYHGGSLYQCLEKERPGGLMHMLFNKYPFEYPTHRVSVSSDSKLYSLVEKDSLFVNSFHHQGVKQVGTGLKAVSQAQDGIVEALELDDDRFMVGVQWHPEMMAQKCSNAKDIFTNFIKRCNA